MKATTINRSIGILMAGAIALLAMAHTAPRLMAADESPTVQFVAGDVQILTGTASRKATVGDRVSVKDTVVTGKDAMADLQFGESGMVRINENTRVTVTALLSDQKADAQAELSQGSLYCLFAKLVKNSSFQVKTTTAVASVRGTGFRVAEDAEGFDLAVLAGTVKVAPFADGVVHRDLATDVGEDNGIRLRRAEIRAMVKERRALRAARIEERIRTRYFDDVDRIRKRPGFERLNKNIRGEIEERIMKRRELRREMRQEMKQKIRDKRAQRDGDDRDDRREKIQEKIQQKREAKGPRR